MADQSRTESSDSPPVVLGRVSGVLGVQGWIKVFSYTRPMDNIFGYGLWTLRKSGAMVRCELAEGRQQGRGLVAKLRGVDDRDAALSLIDSEICVERADMPDCEQGEYYWADLIGMEVVTIDGVALGTVDSLLETGANDVLVVTGDRKHLIPFVQPDVVRHIDLGARQMEVDWDPEF
ncbi:MAG: ribosome maturation factor RimM [Gammaproteobacteria bacterium]